MERILALTRKEQLLRKISHRQQARRGPARLLLLLQRLLEGCRRCLLLNNPLRVVGLLWTSPGDPRRLRRRLLGGQPLTKTMNMILSAIPTRNMVWLPLQHHLSRLDDLNPSRRLMNRMSCMTLLR